MATQTVSNQHPATDSNDPISGSTDRRVGTGRFDPTPERVARSLAFVEAQRVRTQELITNARTSRERDEYTQYLAELDRREQALFAARDTQAEAAERVERKRSKVREFMAEGDPHALAVIKASVEVHSEDCRRFRNFDIMSVPFAHRQGMAAQYADRYREASERLEEAMGRLGKYMARDFA